MPYTTRSAPRDVKRRFSGHCLEVWVEVFNSTLARTDNESRAFATAETAGQRCRPSKSEEFHMPEMKASDRSFDEIRQVLSDALRASRGNEFWVVETYEDRIVYSESGKTWEVSYTLTDDGEVAFGDRVEVTRRVSYQAVKFAKGSDTEIEGLGIPFGGPIKGKDIDGEDFGPDTDLCLDWFPEGRPILYHHGLNGAVKTEVVGRQTSVELRDEGAWVKGELDKRSRWYSRVKKLVDAAAVGFSSGAMPHLVRTTKSGHIERWPWVELSLTPTNANPGAVAYAVKADADSLISGDEDDPGSGSFDDHAARVVTDVEGLLERTSHRMDLRSVKAGRELSASNRTWLQSLDERIGAMAELRREIKAALARTDPDARKAVEELEAELLVSELRRAGLNV